MPRSAGDRPRPTSRSGSPHERAADDEHRRRDPARQRALWNINHHAHARRSAPRPQHLGDDSPKPPLSAAMAAAGQAPSKSLAAPGEVPILRSEFRTPEQTPEGPAAISAAPELARRLTSLEFGHVCTTPSSVSATPSTHLASPKGRVHTFAPEVRRAGPRSRRRRQGGSAAGNAPSPGGRHARTLASLSSRRRRYGARLRAVLRFDRGDADWRGRPQRRPGPS